MPPCSLLGRTWNWGDEEVTLIEDDAAFAGATEGGEILELKR